LREVKFLGDRENTTKKNEKTETCKSGSTFRGDMMLEE